MEYIKTFFKYVWRIVEVVLILVVLLFALSALYSKYYIETQTAAGAAPETVHFQTLEGGEEMAYQETQNGAPTTIVFVGGLSAWSGSWARTVTKLDTALRSKGLSYNLLAIDLPPFGFSVPDTTKGFFRTTQADRIIDFIKSRGIKDVIFVAHSYGAGPVTEAVMKDGVQVRKLIIIDGVLNIDEAKPSEKTFSITNPLKTPWFLQTMILGLGHYEFLIKNRLAGFVYKKDHIDDSLTRMYMQSFSVLGTSRKLGTWLSDYLTDPLDAESSRGSSYKKLSIPVRVIWGDHDTVTPLSLGKQLTGLVPQSELYILKNVGHIPMIEDYEQFDAALLKAITE